MQSKQKTEYVVGQRPPVTLTAKARKQLAAAKPSTTVASFAKIVATLVTTPNAPHKSTVISELQTLKPGDSTKALSAEDASRSSFRNHGKSSSKKRIAKAA
jgi:uncharacterized protein (DUF58 family)